MRLLATILLLVSAAFGGGACLRWGTAQMQPSLTFGGGEPAGADPTPADASPNDGDGVLAPTDGCSCPPVADGACGGDPGSPAGDPLPPAALAVVDNRPVSIDITSVGRFSLQLTAAGAWSVTDWRDLRRDPGTNLAGRVSGPSVTAAALQEPFQFALGINWCIFDNLTSAAVTLDTNTPDLVVWTNTWTWVIAAGNSFRVEATNSLHADGIWDVTATLTNTGTASAVVDTIESPHTSVRKALEWGFSVTPTTTSWYAFTRLTPPGGSRINVLLAVPIAGPPSSDELGFNAWWADGPFTLPAAGNLTRSWTNELGWSY